ncbi:hypothetical protein GCM10027076_14430 [Nocardioides montaniterrae]
MAVPMAPSMMTIRSRISAVSSSVASGRQLVGWVVASGVLIGARSFRQRKASLESYAERGGCAIPAGPVATPLGSRNVTRATYGVGIDIARWMEGSVARVAV